MLGRAPERLVPCSQRVPNTPDRDRHDDDQADQELPVPAHARATISSGLPSMKPFTIGSSEARTSSGVPSIRITPS